MTGIFYVLLRWNVRNQNKSQHRKLTLEQKIFTVPSGNYTYTNLTTLVFECEMTKSPAFDDSRFTPYRWMRTVRNQSFYQRNRCHMVLRCLPTQTNRDKRHRPTETNDTDQHETNDTDQQTQRTRTNMRQMTQTNMRQTTQTNMRQTIQTNRDKRHRPTETNDTD